MSGFASEARRLGARDAAGGAPAVPSPYDAPELYDLMFDALDFDLPFWLDVARGARGPVLEVGCGTGRVLLRLLAAGIDADGVDLSAPMLERLRHKAAAQGLRAMRRCAQWRNSSPM